MNIIRS